MSDKKHIEYEIRPLGDRALTIEFAAAVSFATAGRVRMLAEALRAANIRGIRDTVPSFCSLAVHYDPLVLLDDAKGHAAYEVLSGRLTEIVSRVSDVVPKPARTIEIPVCYGGEYGEDIGTLSAAHGLSEPDVIELHSAATYFVGMLGFAPGFPYLAGLDEQLVTPRRATPRPRVPRGSVAIGGEHTGIYPLELPGGWHLIGRTPLTLFDPSRDPPSLLAAGDQVRFVPIAPTDFDVLLAEAPWP